MKTVIKILKIAIVIFGAVLMVLHFIPGTSEHFTKILSYLATMALPFVGDFFRLIGIKISLRFELAYLLFLIPAMLVGIDLDLYKWEAVPYDKIVHMASGVLTAFGAREVLNQASGKPDKVWFKALFSMSFVALVAVLWECFEFICDQIGGLHMQELISTGVADTMYDMIVALIGGAIGTVLAFPVKIKKRRGDK